MALKATSKRTLFSSNLQASLVFSNYSSASDECQSTYSSTVALHTMSLRARVIGDLKNL